MDCLFCKIVNGTIPAGRIFEDDVAIAFRDINPQAPFHVLLVPKKHLTSLDEITGSAEDKVFLGHLIALVSQIARIEGLTGGYRTVVNTGADGGQTVGHLHLHLLGKRAMQWPPG